VGDVLCPRGAPVLRIPKAVTESDRNYPFKFRALRYTAKPPSFRTMHAFIHNSDSGLALADKNVAGGAHILGLIGKLELATIFAE
jgi:hypothetical protein